VVVVPLALHWENRLSLIKPKEGSAHKAAQILKNCMGTRMAFESQVETPESRFSKPCMAERGLAPNCEFTKWKLLQCSLSVKFTSTCVSTSTAFPFSMYGRYLHCLTASMAAGASTG